MSDVFWTQTSKRSGHFRRRCFCRASGLNTACARNHPHSAPCPSGRRINSLSQRECLRSAADVEFLEKPNPRKDGLLPFVIKRLKHLQPEIEKEGHKIRFAVARGPLNIASFLMGATEFLMAIKTDPERMHRLLTITTDFLVEWIDYQRECFPSIDGILLLDDIVGFVSRRDFETFALPYLKRAFSADVTVKFFHNDAPCKVSAPFPAGDRHQSPQFRHAAHAGGNEGVDWEQDYIAGEYSAARCAGKRDACRRDAIRYGDASSAGRSLAPDCFVRRRHASRRVRRKTSRR